MATTAAGHRIEGPLACRRDRTRTRLRVLHRAVRVAPGLPGQPPQVDARRCRALDAPANRAARGDRRLRHTYTPFTHLAALSLLR